MEDIAEGEQRRYISQFVNNGLKLNMEIKEKGGSEERGVGRKRDGDKKRRKKEEERRGAKSVRWRK